MHAVKEKAWLEQQSQRCVATEWETHLPGQLLICYTPSNKENSPYNEWM